jgi:hypothetical protein
MPALEIHGGARILPQRRKEAGIAFIGHGGETNWMEGRRLPSVSATLSPEFFVLPG